MDNLNCIKILAQKVKEVFETADICICEGSFIRSFSLNITNAVFCGDKALIVSLYAPLKEIYNRLKKRSPEKIRNWTQIYGNQVEAMRSAKKFHKIGVKVLQYDTTITSIEEIVEAIIRNCNIK